MVEDCSEGSTGVACNEGLWVGIDWEETLSGNSDTEL
jgi:hypothetical protein